MFRSLSLSRALLVLSNSTAGVAVGAEGGCEGFSCCIESGRYLSAMPLNRS